VLEAAVPLVRYRDWLRASQTAHELFAQVDRRQPLTATAAGMRDALNAAWAARLHMPAEAIPALGDWAFAACEAHAAARTAAAARASMQPPAALEGAT